MSSAMNAIRLHKEDTKRGQSHYVLELPLSVSDLAEHRLNVAFEKNRHLYNAVLSHGLGVLGNMRQTNRYREACEMPKLLKEPVIDRKTGKQKRNRKTGKPEFKIV